MLQMSSAMEYIHMQGIVHRDIKADNILLAHPEGHGPLCIKVADFGVATVLSTVAGSAALLSNRGTEVYYAPERGNQQAYGAKADMWALGMMLTELVTLSQINKGLWHSGSEVSERRGKVLQQVATKDEALGKLAKDLLHMDKDCRLSAPALHTELRVLVRSRKADTAPACGTPAAPSRDNGIFNLADLAVKLVEPEAVHNVLAEVHTLSQQRAADPDALKDLQQLHHWLGRHIPVLKNPPVDMLKTVVQLASQEPAGSRLLQEAEAALQKAQTLQQEVIEWANKPAAQLPCVMEIREHSESVLAVAVSPDGKWIASGSADKTVKVVEVDTGRVVHTLKGHR
jgi:serine/threonine protein kinase